jgi:hypothetical protein
VVTSREMLKHGTLSSKVHLPGRESVDGKLLNKNLFFNDAAVPFLDAPASHRPYDYFLHVSSSDPIMYRPDVTARQRRLGRATVVAFLPVL